MTPRTKAAIGRQNRKRGQEWERACAKLLATLWPDARRNLSQVRSGRKEGCDVLGTPYFVECKTGRVDIAKAWRQAEADRAYLYGDIILAGMDDPPPILLMVRETRRKPYVVFLHYLNPPNGAAVKVRVDLADWMRAQLEARQP